MSVTRNEDGTVEFIDGGMRHKLTKDGLYYWDREDGWMMYYDFHEDHGILRFRTLLAEAIIALDHPPIKCHCSVPSYKCPDLYRCSTGPREKVYPIGDSK